MVERRSVRSSGRPVCIKVGMHLKGRLKGEMDVMEDGALDIADDV